MYIHQTYSHDVIEIQDVTPSIELEEPDPSSFNQIKSDIQHCFLQKKYNRIHLCADSIARISFVIGGMTSLFFDTPKITAGSFLILSLAEGIKYFYDVKINQLHIKALNS